ncbi:MAG: RagB/SusD family nutrient uptake outer membrane protein, partial [Cytophagales bacterium]|nr:RagB/SusD family nutrient uptake outer membrane protein [Cytophagales bacterium]
LVPNFTDLFNPAKKAAARIEHIFDAEFASNSLGQGNNQAPRGARRGVPGIPSGAYADQLRFYTKGSDKFFSVYKLYNKADKRLAVDAQGYGAYRRFYVGSDGKKYFDLNVQTISGVVIRDTVPYLNKYWDAAQASNLSQSAANVPIIRFAEVLLIHAEAENEANGGPTPAAYSSINRVRTRAGLPNLTPGLTQNAFRDSVYLDRRLELVWENQRWFDLIRQKDSNGQDGTYLLQALNAVGKTSVQAKHYLYPIPLQEIQLNPKLTQNPGW